MLAIFKREMRSMFHNVSGFLFLGITLGLYGLFFFTYNLSYGYPYIAYSLSHIAFVFLITVPILTMRILAEEKKSRTDQLLLTSPVPMIKIMIGKYLALACTYTIAVLIIAISPVIMRIFGEIPMGENYVGLLGFWLYGLACLAIGLFASSLCENVLISAILSFVFIFIGYLMNSITSALSSNGNILTKILNCYDIYTPLDKFFNGILTIPNIVYYLTLIVIMIFLSCQSWQKRRWTISKKMLSTSVFSIGMIVVVIAASVGINFGVRQIPNTYSEIDTTESKLYKITDETKKYLQSLNQDINIYVLIPESKKDANVDKTLGYISSASKHIKVSYIDTDANPTFTQKYSDSTINPNSIIVECGEKYKIINYGSTDYQMMDSEIYTYEVDQNSYSYQITEYDCEGQVMAAIQYVLSDSNTVAYELTGHDETGISGDFQEIFAKKFVDLEVLDLLKENAIPDDCSALFIMGPHSDLSAEDVAKIEKYLDNGGQVFVSLDYASISNEKNLQSLLKYMNIQPTETLVYDQDESYYIQSGVYLLPEVIDTDATTDIAGMSKVLMPYSVGLTYTGENADACTSYLSTSDKAVAKSMANLDNAAKNGDASSLYTVMDGDEVGQYSLAMTVVTDAKGRITVVGSYVGLSDVMVSSNGDTANSTVSGRNAVLFNGLVNGLIADDGNAANAIVIPAKDYKISSITVSENARLVYGLIWAIVMPVVIIVVGIIIWLRRRHL